MFIQTATGLSAGPLDMMCILKLKAWVGDKYTYHAAIFEEYPMPGPVQGMANELSFVRLKSKMHHTDGASTMEEAQTHLDELRAEVEIPDSNVIRDRAVGVADPNQVWILGNWLDGKTLSQVMTEARLLEPV